jgi:UDP-N-acetyl-D-glucosamine dehydrogenase
MASSLAEALLNRIDSRQARVGILGLGYVGLPLARAFHRAGFPILGFDIDASKIERLGRGESYILSVDTATIREMRASGRFDATADPGRLVEADALIMCVPTPLTPTRDPDISFVRDTAVTIGRVIRPGQLVVLESTTYPGTTREVVLPELVRGGLTCGTDVFLGFSPEREDPGNPSFRTETIPKVVSGMDPASARLVERLYAAAVQKVVPVSTCEVAEAAKLLENIYRCVNIALMNDLKVVFERMGIDVWEVIRAASTKPFGFHPFYPGPGLGGHCIPIDPYYLSWKARAVGATTHFIELAGEINSAMPRYVVDRVAEALNRHGKPVRGSRILILGVAYKRDVDDARESPAFEILELLQEREARVAYHDPYIPRLPRMRRHAILMESVPLTDATLCEQDCALIVTDHTRVDYAKVVELAPLVVDTRNATREVTRGREKIVQA